MVYDSSKDKYYDIDFNADDYLNDGAAGISGFASPDGRFVYVSNRGEDTIACFAVNPESGRISLSSSASTRGWYPRDFILTRDEKLLIAANQLSDNLVIYERDSNSGLLSLTDEQAMPQKPIALWEY